jgi:uncharacterized protein with PIN domain
VAKVETFLCDGMLGSLARWLRLLGFDAAYAGSQMKDEEVLAWAEREGRFLVTRDLGLVQRCIKKGVPALLLKHGTKEEQMLILLMHSGAQVDPARFFTRCTECGELLAQAPLAEVADRVPPAVQQSETVFWRCPRCGHVYWKGSHVTEIEKKILDLVRQISDSGQRRL